MATPQSPLISLTATTETPFDVRMHPSQSGLWRASGRFKVGMMLRAGLPNQADFEYRQNIKGTATRIGGVWADGMWLPVGAPSSMAMNFLIPADGKTGAGPGLLNFWKEDGIIDNHTVRRYGYRASRMRDGAQVLDGWTGGGNFYWAVDNPGISGTLTDGLRLSFRLHFVGACYNVREKKTYFFRDWLYERTRTLRRRSDGSWAFT